jgi:hypothetical protein
MAVADDTTRGAAESRSASLARVAAKRRRNHQRPAEDEQQALERAGRLTAASRRTWVTPPSAANFQLTRARVRRAISAVPVQPARRLCGQHARRGRPAQAKRAADADLSAAARSGRALEAHDFDEAVRDEPVVLPVGEEGEDDLGSRVDCR